MFNRRTKKQKIIIRRRIIEIISGISWFVGFGLIIGTAGASDCDMIEMNQIIVRGVIGTAILLVGCFGAWLLDETR